MKNKIPKYWSEQFKDFTGLEPTLEHYEGNENMFDPRTEYEKNPILAWFFFVGLIVYSIYGIKVVFFT